LTFLPDLVLATDGICFIWCMLLAENAVREGLPKWMRRAFGSVGDTASNTAAAPRRLCVSHRPHLALPAQCLPA